MDFQSISNEDEFDIKVFLHDHFKLIAVNAKKYSEKQACSLISQQSPDIKTDEIRCEKLIASYERGTDEFGKERIGWRINVLNTDKAPTDSIAAIPVWAVRTRP